MIEVAHLLDDFGMGGVTRALTLFEGPALRRLARSKVVPVDPKAKLAPLMPADLIVDHMALSWKRLPFLISLRARHPRAHIVHVEHSYTRAFEQLNVQSKARFRAMLKIASLLVDEIVCVSNAQRDWLAHDVGIAWGKLRVIHPWTDRHELFAVPVARRENAQPVRLLAYGRYAPVKNFAQLIEAMRRVSPDTAELILFGDGPDDAELKASAADLQHVEVLGPSNSPADFLARCDAVVVPSRYEAFGLVATEARMAGRAILVADVDGLPEQVGEAGLTKRMDTPDTIANAIHTFVQTDLAIMGAAGRGAAKSQLNAIIARWVELISKVCA